WALRARCSDRVEMLPWHAAHGRACGTASRKRCRESVDTRLAGWCLGERSAESAKLEQWCLAPNRRRRCGSSTASTLACAVIPGMLAGTHEIRVGRSD